jgi:MEMO1 family protein
MERNRWTRPPAVAGRFYPGAPLALEREVAACLAAGPGPGRPPISVLAVMAPHAGYVYSGGIAGQVFARVQVPDRVVILGPNHTGRGARISVMAAGGYQLPGGDVPIDEELAAAILAEVPGAEPDREAHRAEHSIEVELPLLRARQPRLRIAPVVLGGLSETEAIAVGEGLARAIATASRAGGPVLVVASSDMSHFLTEGEARRVDQIALDALLGGDPAALYRTVRDHDISMCGVLPATAMLAYARAAGGGAPQLVAYTTSAQASGDTSRVVGYAGVLVPAR